MSTVVSAPGKVLLTGAYLVLEQPHAGLVLSTSARFYAVINAIYHEPPSDSGFWSWTDVRVISPQLSKDTSYKISLRTCKIQSSRINFVEDAIQYAVAAAFAISETRGSRSSVYEKLLQGLEITILGSNDFYSFRRKVEENGLPLTAASLKSLPEFSPIFLNDGGSTMAPELAKTGLGSSAAMTTAIVAGILQHFGILQLPTQTIHIGDGLDLVHAISQAAHCHAQGKVGSGFDVSAAVYGSQRYVRFSPSVVDGAISGHGNLDKAIQPLLNMDGWDCKMSKFALPRMLHLMLGEPGHGGSHTPSMVGAVNKWRKKSGDAARIWKQLGEANETVENDLLELETASLKHPESYVAALTSCSTSRADEWESLEDPKNIIALLVKARHDFIKVRSLLRHIGAEAEAPIEPSSQTELLNETMNLPGVLISGVPGAGGYDAVFAITIGEKAKDIVEKNWSQKGVLALTVHEDPQGVRAEDFDPRMDTTGIIQNQLATLQLH